MRVTGEEVKAAMLAANITHVDHHDCGLCGYMTKYWREGEQLYFDRGCDCSWGGSEPKSWEDAAAWINMQNDPKWHTELRKRFGLPVSEECK